ncbi:hypothetical protein SAMN05216490_5068 [Mucilaginibacter mallensis]|uniref:Uncharacterized protein n=1 Tax=Mucilaginibacter mallensis TaxID=652787 RepID=A0A1H2CH21_MUCMA|nr:hypothetical protein [Mucilaginibacter mallensis]SDT69810.1 hypothetical protein SAMN05216490_5068 [Mucilaginibacter mallensis]
MGHFNNSEGMMFITILLMAIGLGVYGVFILFNLTQRIGYRLQDQQVDRVLIGTVNITLSIVAICILISMTNLIRI